ncbi:hypothetical protein DSUL_100229 [Desulfovibrionales bacterium]
MRLFYLEEHHCCPSYFYHKHPTNKLEVLEGNKGPRQIRRTTSQKNPCFCNSMATLVLQFLRLDAQPVLQVQSIN